MVMRACLLGRCAAHTWLLFVACMAMCAVHAAAATRVGPVYSIQEPDMLEHIANRLGQMQKDGTLKKLETQAIERAKKAVQEPAPTLLPRATEARVWWVDPTYEAPQDFADHKGVVFAPAGTRVNPLQRGAKLRQPLLFVDATDAAQSRALPRLLSQYPDAKLILTAGRWADVAQRLQRQVFFDQGGKLVQAFGVMALPAVIVQDNLMLKGHEIIF